MKVSKRDFLKLLTAGGSVAGLAGGAPKTVTRSLEFPHKKGLTIPSQMYFDPMIQTQGGQADAKGTGIDFAMGLEGIEFRGVQ